MFYKLELEIFSTYIYFVSLQTSLANQVSQQSESFDLTPVKRIRGVSIDLEAFPDDENSVTRTVHSVKIKKEKFAKSG